VFLTKLVIEHQNADTPLLKKVFYREWRFTEVFCWFMETRYGN